jgi:hypothetical protein
MRDVTRKFIEEAEEYGLEVEPYHGRGFYFGPMVRVDVDELQDFIRATTVRVQTDSAGMSSLVVYPVVSDTEWYEETTGTKVTL